MKFALTVFTISLLCFSCAKEEVNNKTKPQKVKITSIHPSSDQLMKVVTGTSHPNKEVNLSFRVQGPLIVFDVEDGQYFRKGEIIGQIDQRDYLIAFNNAKAKLKWSKQEFDRAKQLIDHQNISQQQYDQLEMNFITAEHDFKNAENALRDTKLVAPFNGYVKNTYTEKGEHLRVSQKVVTFQDYSKVKVNCVVNEDIALHPGKISNIQVVFDGKKEEVFQAKLVEISRDTEGLTNAYPCIVEVKVKDRNLIGGMTSEVYFDLAKADKNDVIVPSTAVINKANGEQFVWAVQSKDHTLHSLKVKVNTLLNDGQMEVELLEKTDANIIVAAGGTYLSEGQEVRYTIDEPMMTAKN
ncbi:efflux RND transporter periplasmic adaptor subunit [Flammeovirga yaeyamensis]|uniref:Efflux RND transporter periplasmic adaptor subunit n=1 Tax=Flammeovirga yaeyamensis TaxID=367791 RepID=A0AAX1NEK0_9BACT|nr:efflux RND transporter periplasmic adaptor subunit [Flammeovirga yaeyamensis]MBB3697260.1 RND family efflux transporter MFP subunit [Flammeovirga yaeyamensis]NMF33918.1 efflux RND transporter periplasmic adaptor subunit [Flammeovirga yaeyamensis]QWG04822.1 efflux RND transporter periplasmic adaptor subunit [Flammeovirga yaeyamensis]